MYDARTNLSREVEQEVRQHFPNTFATVIPRSVRLAEAPSHGQPIQEYDSLSAGSRAYEALADEFLAALGGHASVGARVEPSPVPVSPTAASPAGGAPTHEPEGQY